MNISWRIGVQFATEDIHIMPFNICEFMQIGHKGSASLRDVNEIYPYFLNFLSDLDSIWYRFSQLFFEWSWVSWESVQWKPCFTQGCKWNYVSTSQIYYPIWVKFITRYPCIMLFSIGEFCENWCGERSTFIMGTNEILLACVL